MPSESEMIQAVRKKFLTSGLFPVEQIALENRNFNPGPGGAPWARLTHLPAGKEPFEFGRKGHDLVTGLLQIDINYPCGKGDGLANSMADNILNLYQTGMVLLQGASEVVISKSFRSSGQPVAGFYMIALTVQWYGFLQRNV
jgi:hypothetical protein